MNSPTAMRSPPSDPLRRSSTRWAASTSSRASTRSIRRRTCARSSP